MTLEKKPFTNYKLESEKVKDKGRTFTVWMSENDDKWLKDAKRLIRQPKDSTALKQLAQIGAKLLGEPSMSFSIDTLFKNNRKNERLGINI